MSLGSGSILRSFLTLRRARLSRARYRHGRGHGRLPCRRTAGRSRLLPHLAPPRTTGPSSSADGIALVQQYHHRQGVPCPPANPSQRPACSRYEGHLAAMSATTAAPQPYSSEGTAAAGRYGSQSGHPCQPSANPMRRNSSGSSLSSSSNKRVRQPVSGAIRSSR